MANANGADHVRYVVVVHGIGDQRKNETVLDVINRFAELRAGATKPGKGDPLTLGMASGQTADINVLTGKSRPWIEFEGIPCSPAIKPTGTFLARAVANDDGDNIRFVDICWSDVMNRQFPQVGEDVAVWTSSLIERLKRHPLCPGWALRLLVIMRKAVLLVQKIMLLKFPSLSVKIFNDFLGDVQLYGEYGPCRAQGVRRFHELMADVQAAHDLEQETRLKFGKTTKPARYTILAHSLGTIMSLDALLYACADSGRRSTAEPHFAGYLREGESEDQNPLYSTKRWIGNVDAFVTLGSPVDKYLVFWWLNYEYLTDDSWLSLPIRDGDQRKIKHFNYSDEQDPVGGELDVAHMTAAVNKLFTKEEDLVFTRYPIPAVAHVDYWRDLDLINEIAQRAVDKVGEATKRTKGLKPFRVGKYLCALGFNYFLIPFVFWAALSFSMMLAIDADSWHTRIVFLGIFGAALYLTTKLFHFVIEGRQVVMYKIQKSEWPRRLATSLLPAIYLWLLCLTSPATFSQFAPLSQCLKQGSKPFFELVKLCGPQEFILSGLGMVIVLYGLSIYIYYKLRNSKIERIISFKEYIEVAR